MRGDIVHKASSPEEIARLLRTSYAPAVTGTVAIDGTDGVGKTALAMAVQRVIGGTVISLDDFVEENRGGYIPYLRAAELRSALDKADRPCIVEGVCVLAALDRISHIPDVLIYVERLASYGYWHDEETCDPTEPVEELIERLAKQVAMLARFDPEVSDDVSLGDETPALTPLREEIIRYHDLYRPSHRAEIIFMNTDEPGGSAAGLVR